MASSVNTQYSMMPKQVQVFINSMSAALVARESDMMEVRLLGLTRDEARDLIDFIVKLEQRRAGPGGVLTPTE
jgi:hypothetical protein